LAIASLDILEGEKEKKEGRKEREIITGGKRE
jgi:hypothetical protein